MKASVLSLLAALLIAALLAGCGAPAAEAPAVSEAADTPAPVTAPATPEPAAAPIPSPGAAPILTAGAADASALSAPYGFTAEGTLLTADLAGEGAESLAERYPGIDGYISGFLMDGEWIYAAVKDSFYSLEPTKLWRFPAAGGEGALLSEDLSAAPRFCLAGDFLFYQSYADEGLWRLNTATGAAERVIAEPSPLTAAADGFIYYARSGGVYRNDSTMTAEVFLFPTNVLRLYAEGDCLCGLTFTADGSAAIAELRSADGELTAQVTLPERTDNLLLLNGRVYIPQPEAGELLVYDTEGTALPSLSLAPLGTGCTLCCGDADALYYETVTGTDRCLVRLPLDGGEGRIIAQVSLLG